MSLRVLRITLLLAASISATGFRMPVKSDSVGKPIYDVRGAFVTARPDISPSLVTATDLLVDRAIRSTLRPILLPRTIIVIRIDHASKVPLLIGSRQEARVTVQAVSVGDGEPIAEGSFVAAIYQFGKEGGDEALAAKIADRVASEFKLDGSRHPTLATALWE